MKLFQYELKKLIANKWLFILLFIFLVINVGKILFDYSILNNDKEYIYAKNEIYQNLKGTLNNQKIDFLITKYNYAKKEVDNNNLSYNSDYYTGYAFGDLSLYEEFLEKVQYIIDYNKNITEITDIAQENTDFFSQINKRSYNENLYYLRVYKDRSLINFYDNSGILEYFNYDFSSLLLIFLIAFALIPIFINEYDSKMYIIINTSMFGRKRSIINKLLISIIFIVFICLIFYLCDFVLYQQLYHFEGLSEPLYSIPDYKYTFYNGTIISYMIINFSFKTLGMLLIGAFVLLLTSFFKNYFFPFILNVSLICLLITFDDLSKNNFLNPISLLVNRYYFTNCNLFYLGSKCINKVCLILFGYLIVYICTLIIIFLLKYKNLNFGDISVIDKRNKKNIYK